MPYSFSEMVERFAIDTHGLLSVAVMAPMLGAFAALLVIVFMQPGPKRASVVIMVLFLAGFGFVLADGSDYQSLVLHWLPQPDL